MIYLSFVEIAMNAQCIIIIYGIVIFLPVFFRTL